MQQRVYFPGLNALRFFAAFAVVITHVELMRKMLGFSSGWRELPHSAANAAAVIASDDRYSWWHPIFAEAGPLGVIFFFVLSGFLITYLLFVEREQSGGISVRSFYLRRIFRIWPLYYLIFAVGFLLLPFTDLFYVPAQSEWLENHYWLNFLLYLIILPNLALALSPLGTSVPGIGQSWSIGVEEQFYLIWPILMKCFRRPLGAILTVSAIWLVLKALVAAQVEPESSYVWNALKTFLALSKIECMTAGALGAWLLYHKKQALLRWLFHPIIQIAAIAAVPLFVFFFPYQWQDGVHLFHSAAFLVIILNVAANPISLLRLNNKWLDHLGRISYGIYMYHMIMIVLVLNIAKNILFWQSDLSIAQVVVVYGCSIALTIFVSYISYQWFERRFISRKSKFSKVLSGEEAKTN
jgi:peptidoglycan/LPS O-acetylase OafA/YrhL